MPRIQAPAPVSAGRRPEIVDSVICMYLSQLISSHRVRENSKLFLVSVLVFTLMFHFLNY